MNFLLGNILLVILLVLLEYYFFRKINRSLKYLYSTYAKLRIKTIKIILLIIINAYPIYAMIYFQYHNLTGEGRVRIPTSNLMDYFLVYPFWIFLMVMVQCILIFLLLEIVKLLSRIFRYPADKRKKYDAVSSLLILLFFLVYVPARVYHDSNTVMISEVVFNTNGKAKALKGLKITFISDLQADRYTDEELLQSYIEKVNKSDPDIVLIAGDLITSTPDYIQTAAKWTGRISSKYGVFSCVGDHDNWAYRPDYARSLREISTALAQNNVKMINNGNMSFQHGNSGVTVSFVTNTYVGSVSEATLDSLSQNADSADLKIFLTHQPAEWLVKEAAEKKYDMMLAGHTHGGQISFLFPFISLTPTLFETKYVRGEFKIDDMILIVCRGLGVSILPVRYNSTPEIVVISVK